MGLLGGDPIEWNTRIFAVRDHSPATVDRDMRRSAAYAVPDKRERYVAFI